MSGLSEDAIPVPPFPFSFLKPTTSLAGSGATVVRPAYGRALDWEAELAVVIGDGSAASGPDPLAAVFGYTIVNELSLRDFYPFPHVLGLDAVVSKGFDGAAPMGPWITLAEDVPDPQSLAIKLTLNGEVMQDSSTAKMIFSVRDLIAHYGRVLTLEPGDVLATGTPSGVGAGRRPPRFLRGGDDVEVCIGDLGCLRTTISEPAGDDLLLAEQVAADG
jgi:2-keto-4-pentenoate hydratase/2-oxohepta-3-ene-1,7-dioic acid hydratase in catechol pathway